MNGALYLQNKDLFETFFKFLLESIDRAGFKGISKDKLKREIILLSKKNSASKFESSLNKEESFDWGELESLSGLEFEKFLVKLFRHNGYGAEITKGSGDQGADMILEDDLGNKIAVQAKKWQGPVGNSAIQQVVASKKFYDCDNAWVISTNNKFTKSAIALAKRNKVKLIGKNELKEFF